MQQPAPKHAGWTTKIPKYNTAKDRNYEIEKYFVNKYQNTEVLMPKYSNFENPTTDYKNTVCVNSSRSVLPPIPLI